MKISIIALCSCVLYFIILWSAYPPQGVLRICWFSVSLDWHLSFRRLRVSFYFTADSLVPRIMSSTWYALGICSVKPKFSHLRLASALPVLLTSCTYKRETPRRHLICLSNSSHSSHFCLPLRASFTVYAPVLLRLHPASRCVLSPSLPRSRHWEAESW